MTWFAFHGYNGGKAVDIAGTQEKEAVTLGFHGYGTEQQAEAAPNSVNWLNSWFVNGIVADYSYAVKAGEQPGGPNAGILNPVNDVKGAAQAAGSVTTGWTHNIEQWIIRGFEMLLGLGLIIVSVAKLASDTPAGRAAIKAGKVAAVL